ncbi:MAG: transposase [Candidatus Cloacimonadales bacterium]|nr:transposase [Candidatus Cloacimonadales bacterium]
MFRKNTSHEQLDFFDYEMSSPDEIRKMVEKTEEYAFYRLIFCNIREEQFSCLYCNDNGRPNSPVNAMISALILKDRKNWSYSELFKQLHFNLAVRASVGLFNLGTIPFNEATIFNFQNRMSDYYGKTGVNLFELAFDNLTKNQLHELKLKTNIARTDSFMINSNIRRYGRFQLLLEVVLRLYRILSESDQELFRSQFSSYTEQTSEHYLYYLKGSDLPHEFEKISEIYYWLHTHLSSLYENEKEYQIFQRVYEEHFKLSENDKLELIPSQEIKSNFLQSPDDEDATYRRKNGEDHRGYVGNVVETCHPDNPLNLIVDVATQPNNVDDSNILNDRLDSLDAKLPDLEELHFDGAYGSEANDEIFEEKGITPVQTAVRGQDAAVEMEIEEIQPEVFQVTCPRSQTVPSKPTKTRHKALFDNEICSSCPLQSRCPAIQQKKGRVFYFSRKDYLRKQRHRQILKLPPERNKLRSNVEATMFEFVYSTKNHKLKVRGYFKASLFVFSKAIGINFGRIYRHMMKNISNNSQIFVLYRMKMVLRLILRIVGRFWNLFEQNRQSNIRIESCLNH